MSPVKTQTGGRSAVRDLVVDEAGEQIPVIGWVPSQGSSADLELLLLIADDEAWIDLADC